MQVVLRRAEGREADLVGQDGQLAELSDHFLVMLVVPAYRPQPLAFLRRTGNGGQSEEIEFHGSAPALP